MHRHFENYNSNLISHARRLRREMTNAEKKIWGNLRNNQIGVKIRRQVPFGPYILDFYCQKALLCIELDGSQHYTESGMKRDQKRDAFLQSTGIIVMRFSDIDVLKNTRGVLDSIYETIQQRLKNETPIYNLPLKRGRCYGMESTPCMRQKF